MSKKKNFSIRIYETRNGFVAYPDEGGCSFLDKAIVSLDQKALLDSVSKLIMENLEQDGGKTD